jgi:cation diffusion facilitator family transporter
MSHSHSHSHESTAIKATIFSIVGNTGLIALKILAGIFGNSYALIADAIESTADVFSSFIVLIGLKYTSKPADKKHPYGHGRAEPLITFLVVCFLVMSAVIIGYEAIENIKVVHESPAFWTLFILGPIILWKEYSYRRVMKKAIETNSSSLKADAWHHRADAITSISAFVGISIAVIMGKGWEAADDWGALVAAGFILFNSWLILKPALGEIMDEDTHQDLVKKIESVSLTVDGVVNTEKCFIRKAGMKYHVDLHARVDGNITVTEGHNISGKLKGTLMKELPELEYILIHIEPK